MLPLRYLFLFSILFSLTNSVNGQSGEFYGSWMIQNAPAPMLMTFSKEGSSKSETIGIFEETIVTAKLTDDSLVLDRVPEADYAIGSWTLNQPRYLRFSYSIVEDTLLLSSGPSLVALVRFTDAQRRSKEGFNLKFNAWIVEPDLPVLPLPESLDTSAAEPWISYAIGAPKSEYEEDFGNITLLASFEEEITLANLPTDLCYQQDPETGDNNVSIGLFVDAKTPIAFLKDVVALLKNRPFYFAINTSRNADSVHVTWVRLDDLEKAKDSVFIGDYLKSL